MTAQHLLCSAKLICAVFLAASPAVAQTAPNSAPTGKTAPKGAETKPTDAVTSPPDLQSNLEVTHRAWAIGVSEEEQLVASKLLSEGNTLLKDSLFKAAIEKYNETLTHWDHPGVHYNLALALINLDEPLIVRQHLLRAIAFGAAPLDEKKYEYARNYLKLIDKQLATLELECDEPNATVRLDNTEVMTAPNKHNAILMPGEHHVTVTKPGYLPREYHPMLLPGRTERLTLRVFTEEQLLDRHRRWNFWLPVAVTAGGAALVGGAFLSLVHGNSKLTQYDREVNTHCASAPEKCKATGNLSALRHTGETYQTLSTVGFIAGSAALTTGAVMLYMNMTVTRRMTPEERDKLATLQPVIAPTFIGAFSTTHF